MAGGDKLDAVKAWVLKICITAIFIVLCDLLVPKKFKNVCNMVLGVLMIIVIASPLINLQQNKNLFEREILKNNNFLSKSNIYINRNMLDTQDKDVGKLYAGQLSQQLRYSILATFHIKDIKIDIDLQFKGGDKVIINSVKAVIDEKSDDKIQPIKIEVPKSYAESVNDPAKIRLCMNIRNFIKDFLSINDSKIEVSI